MGPDNVRHLQGIDGQLALSRRPHGTHARRRPRQHQPYSCKALLRKLTGAFLDGQNFQE